jgi:hypothetical protein
MANNLPIVKHLSTERVSVERGGNWRVFFGKGDGLPLVREEVEVGGEFGIGAVEGSRDRR